MLSRFHLIPGRIGRADRQICYINIARQYASVRVIKMNHYRFFIKLIKRLIPDNLLLLFESWFAIGMTCVKWHNVWSRWFCLSCGIQQGRVLSPYLFAIYIDSLVEKVQACGYGCYLRHTCISCIILYADDVLLLAPSVSSLQLILSVCVKKT